MDVLVGAYLDTIPEKQRRRFLRAVFKRLEEADHPNVIPIVGRAEAEVRHCKERGALAWARERLPAWMIGHK